MATFPEALHGASDDTLMPLSQSVDSPMPDASENDTITLLRNWIGEEYALCMLAAKRSSASLWKYLVNMNPPDPGNPLLVQIFVDGYLKPFHPLADQILFQKTEDDLFSYIATLWDDPDPEILPTVDLDNEMPRLLRDWLVHPSLVASALHLDIIVLRTFLERRSPPSEPLRSKIFFKDRLKLFTCPSRKQGEDDVFHHLAALWGPISEPIDSVQTRSKAQKERLFQSMESEFVGGAAAEFSEGMQCYKQLWEENRGLYYGRIVPITAPSGLGKTKMVLHHLASNPGIYICLRSPADSSAQIWPPGDRPITQFFQKYAHQSAAFVSAALLAALMDCACETYANDSSSGNVLSDHNLRWKHKPGSQLGKDHRAENLSKVAEQAEKLVLQKEVKFQEELQTASAGNSSTSLDRARAAVKVVCEESAKRLAEKAPGFIFVIDECTAIPHLYPARQVSPLLRVMESLSNHDLWFVLVSTSSKIISYAPPMDVMPTQRFLNQMSMSPWFFLPFDTFLEDHAPLTTLGEHLAIKELQVYGRPLWKAYTPDEVLTVARTKLLNVPGLVFSNGRLLEQHTFAVYSQRICLTLNPSQSAQLVEIAAVESHMRLAKGFHAGMLITFCPSEPILALTAAMLINETPEYRKNATQSLVTLVSKYRVDRGLEGELYARLVLVMARDVATMCTSSSGPSGFIEETSRGPALRPVTLQSMLAALLKKSAVPAEYLGPLAKIGTDVYVTFTHFVEMHVETAVLDAKWCFDMLCRGTAAQCTFGQPVIDGIIFGYRGDLNQAFDETGIFLVCYRAKARGKAAAAELAASLTCPMIRYSDGRIVKPDHLVILIDMAATTHYQGQGQAFVQHSRRCASVPKGSENNWQGYCDTHGITETPGDFLGICGLEAYEVLDGLDVARLYRSISPEGPLEARFGPPSRVQYNKLTTGTSRW